jgi:hypothetical protein
MLLQVLTPIFDPSSASTATDFDRGAAHRTPCEPHRSMRRREGLGGGYGHHEVLRPCQSRHSDGPDRESDSGQAGVALIGKYLRRGAMVDGVVVSQRGGHAARRAAVSAAGQHLSGCARSGTGSAGAFVLPLRRRLQYLCRQSGGGGTDAGLDTGWIEKHLRLKVNAAKSGTGRVWERKFLGFRLDRRKRIGKRRRVWRNSKRRCGRSGDARTEWHQ